jgi:two-component system torCAD operon response regulator TorR
VEPAVKEALVVIAPEDAVWTRFMASASVLRFEVEQFSGIDAFVARDLPASHTVVIVDADEYKDRIASFVSALAKYGQAGVIAISRHLTGPERVALMCLGADHCVIRPLISEELLAIANNLLRRSHRGGETSRYGASDECWVLDLKQWRLITPHGEDVDLSAAELNLLTLMFQAPGQTRLRTDLRGHFGKRVDVAEDRSIDVMISRLRRKVEDTSSARLPLRSARGEGYVFASPAVIIP